MEQLWAPWRMDLIEKGQPSLPPGCIFCHLPRAAAPASRAEPGLTARGVVDRENLILGRTARTFAILNKFPYNNGHLMVVPRRHTADLGALAPDEVDELTGMLRVAVKILQRSYRPHGLNLGMNLGRAGGAGIADHLHWHAVPRWDGDTNFMPVLGATKVMVEHLRAGWERLRPLFDEQYRWQGAEVREWEPEAAPETG